MQKHEVISLIKPLNSNTDLGLLERLADIGYRQYTFTESHGQNSKPSMELYTRNGYRPDSLVPLEPRSGFLAVYKNVQGGVDFVVLYDGPQGQNPIEQAVRDCKEIERKALRQGILSWPPRILKAAHLKEYGFEYAGLLYLGVSVAAFLYATSNKDMVDNLLKKIREYPEIIHISMVTYVFGFTASAVFGQWFGPYIGSLGDRLRVKGMSSKVVEYKFGEAALQSIREELKKTDLEEEIVRIFDINRARDGSFFRQRVLALIERPNNPDKT